MREYRALVELERAGLAIEHGDADDVGRQQVAGELDALIGQAERFGHRMRQRGLADAGDVLDQQMAARQQARDAQSHLMLLAQDHPIELRRGGGDQLDGVGLRDQSGDGGIHALSGFTRGPVSAVWREMQVGSSHSRQRA